MLFIICRFQTLSFNAPMVFVASNDIVVAHPYQSCPAGLAVKQAPAGKV